ncbi:hypothetical protein ACCO45_012634 [Purpureocillium lilacinum]|uniref:Uncharacterized protein n=1 Tax=Purpureocillium lilacinum TaxID=33203 RepID=A0ACC4DB41_PURLI
MVTQVRHRSIADDGKFWITSSGILRGKGFNKKSTRPRLRIPARLIAWLDDLVGGPLARSGAAALTRFALPCRQKTLVTAMPNGVSAALLSNVAAWPVVWEGTAGPFRRDTLDDVELGVGR